MISGISHKWPFSAPFEEHTRYVATAHNCANKGLQIEMLKIQLFNFVFWVDNNQIHM